MKRVSFLLALMLAVSCGTGREADETGRVVPSASQLQWHDMEYYMFCHFGPNTFTGREWGLGSEDPDVFAPTDLDCRQWARTAVAAGMKGIILTAKHHDGFCLWPSAYSTHTVAQSSWRGGKGDVLREFVDACAEYGLKCGIYISPWDRNHPAYGTPEYNDVFAATINEVHKAYGPFFEQWFDGANDGNAMPYDWALFNGAVLQNNPDAIIFSDIGPGCRWVGNEEGYAGETNWCTLDTDGFTPGAGSPARDTLNCGNRHGSYWIPAECDVSLRDGWFYSPANEGSQKSVDDLMEIWFGSVGRGGNLILNVPPDTTGRITRSDSLRLMEFRAARESYFAKPLAASAGKLTLALGKNPAKCIVLQEDLKYGQRISSFVVEATDGKKWSQIASGTTIGHKRILRFSEPVTCRRMRVRILASDGKPHIRSIEVY